MRGLTKINECIYLDPVVGLVGAAQVFFLVAGGDGDGDGGAGVVEGAGARLARRHLALLHVRVVAVNHLAQVLRK